MEREKGEVVENVTDNPEEYLKKFENSEIFNEIKKTREKKGLKFDIDAVRETDQYKQGFWNFFVQGNHLQFNPENHSDEFKEALNSYWVFLRSTNQKERLMRLGDVQEVDKERSRLHNNASRALLSEGKVPNRSVARLFVHFMSISEGLDRIDRERDERRRRSAA